MGFAENIYITSSDQVKVVSSDPKMTTSFTRVAETPAVDEYEVGISRYRGLAEVS